MWWEMGGLTYGSKEELLAVIASGAKCKPPAWWLEQQATEGRPTVAAASIWHNRYNGTRRYGIWLMSSDDDFRRSGYLKGG